MANFGVLLLCLGSLLIPLAGFGLLACVLLHVPVRGESSSSSDSPLYAKQARFLAMLYRPALGLIAAGVLTLIAAGLFSALT